ncbi:MAG: alpha/beta hydrolase-fold protein [Acidobacteriota bacterium]|nr:alpha/beta hydrolase-fold protein [Acidobacteriota bacterium]NLT31987.1 esterase family protein [Acidobacteriota bacterium]
MKLINTVPLAVLASLLVVGVFARDQAKPAADNKADELPWVTRRVNAARVSFHTFTSRAAKAEISYHVYRPSAYDESETERFPVLYWLHGTEGGVNHIRPVSQMFDLAIRDKIETVFIGELIPHVDKTMRTIPRREGRILEGFSMGGYGSARIGFRHAGLFGGISILAAGPLDLEFEGPRATGNPLRDRILRDVCDGDMAYFKASHPWTVAESQAEVLRKSGTIIRQAVGSRDSSLHLSRRFHEHLKALFIPHEFHIVEGTEHNALALMAGLANSEFYRKALAPKTGDPAAEQPHAGDADKPRC